MDPSSPCPSDNRRQFVKKSLAASIVAAQPTILAGLLRADGGGGGETTTDPWGTTMPQTTSPPTTNPWGTTVPETTVPETTVPETTVPVTTSPPSHDINHGSAEFANAGVARVAGTPDDYYESDFEDWNLPALHSDFDGGNLKFKLKIWISPTTLMPPNPGAHVLDANIKYRGELFGTMKANGGGSGGSGGNWAYVIIRTEKRKFRGVCDSSTGLISQSDALVDPGSGTGNHTQLGDPPNSHRYFPHGGPYHRYIVELKNLELGPEDLSGSVVAGNPVYLKGRVEVALQYEDFEFMTWRDKHRYGADFELQLNSHLHA